MGADVSTLEQRFWAKVARGGNDECWLWLGWRDHGGYGRIRVGARGTGLLGTHRLAYELAHGAIPEGSLVLHSCDNPRCVNPRHLRTGSQAQNLQEAWGRGRVRVPGLRGEESPHAKLTDGLVAELRQKYKGGGWSIRALAERAGVNSKTLTAALWGRTWSHVSEPPVVVTQKRVRRRSSELSR